MYYVRYPQSFHQVEDILHERGIDISHEALLVCLNQKHYTNMVGSLQIYNIANGLLMFNFIPAYSKQVDNLK